MQQFKISHEGFKAIRSKGLLRTIPIMLFAGTIGIILSLSNSNSKESVVNVLPFVIPIVLVALGTGIYIGKQKQRKLFESYTVIFENNLITREQLNTPAISLYHSEIKEIIKNNDPLPNVRTDEIAFKKA